MLITMNYGEERDGRDRPRRTGGDIGDPFESDEGTGRDIRETGSGVSVCRRKEF